MITIHRDDKGFFIKGATGSSCHKFHRRLDPKSEIPVSTKSVSKEEKAILASLGKASGTSAIGRNLYYIRGSSLLTRQQVYSIFGGGAKCKHMTEKYKRKLESVLNEAKSEVAARCKNKTQAGRASGRFASSNPASSKRRKSHGTEYARK
jgi:hypothetical protein